MNKLIVSLTIALGLVVVPASAASAHHRSGSIRGLTMEAG
jgi:hypothetical protein